MSDLYEYMRLYAWMLMPPYLLALFLWQVFTKRNPMLMALPLILVWLLGRAAYRAANELMPVPNDPQTLWAIDACIDAVAAFVLGWIAFERGPRRPLAMISFLFALEVALHLLYGVHLLCQGYDKPTHRGYYWIMFTVAWGQAIVATKQGGLPDGGKRRGVANVHYRHAPSFIRSFSDGSMAAWNALRGTSR